MPVIQSSCAFSQHRNTSQCKRPQLADQVGSAVGGAGHVHHSSSTCAPPRTCISLPFACSCSEFFPRNGSSPVHPTWWPSIPLSRVSSFIASLSRRPEVSDAVDTQKCPSQRHREIHPPCGSQTLMDLSAPALKSIVIPSFPMTAREVMTPVCAGTWARSSFVTRSHMNTLPAQPCRGPRVNGHFNWGAQICKHGMSQATSLAIQYMQTSLQTCNWGMEWDCGRPLHAG
jgi:hypothetical protein